MQNNLKLHYLFRVLFQTTVKTNCVRFIKHRYSLYKFIQIKVRNLHDETNNFVLDTELLNLILYTRAKTEDFYLKVSIINKESHVYSFDGSHRSKSCVCASFLAFLCYFNFSDVHASLPRTQYLHFTVCV